MLKIYGPFFPLLLLFGLLAVICFVQIRLSSMKSGVPGLAVVVISCVVFLGLTVWVNLSGEVYTNREMKCELPEGRTASAMVCLDERETVIGVSDIWIKDADGAIIDEVSFGERRLRDVQEKLRGDYMNLDDIQIHWLDRNSFNHTAIVKVGERYMSRYTFFYLMLLVDVPLLVIYLLKRRQIHQRLRREELRKMSIQEL